MDGPLEGPRQMHVALNSCAEPPGRPQEAVFKVLNAVSLSGPISGPFEAAYIDHHSNVPCLISPSKGNLV